MDCECSFFFFFFKCLYNLIILCLTDVVALLRCSRYSLGIMASSRGAVSGRLLLQAYINSHFCSNSLQSYKSLLCIKFLFYKSYALANYFWFTYYLLYQLIYCAKCQSGYLGLGVISLINVIRNVFMNKWGNSALPHDIICIQCHFLSKLEKNMSVWLW